MEKSVSKSSSSKLKQRFARMLLGSSCSTGANVAAATKPPAKRLPETVNHGWNDRCKLDQHYWSFPADIQQRRCVAPVVHVSINCRDRRSVEASEPLLPLIRKEDRKWKRGGAKKERRKVPFGQRKKSSSFPSSDSLNEDELYLFSSEDEEESKTTLFSSKSFSSDSSEFYHHSKRKNKSTKSKSMKSTRRPPQRQYAAHSTTTELRPLVSISPAKANAGGFPVVKRSTDPYGDFRSSMVEMIVERGMSRTRDLEQLLHSYLKLNSNRHHQVILEAFENICEAMFGK